MIRRVTLRYFKRFESEEFKLADSIVLAGPNNSGKSTLLQALSVWNLAVRTWVTEKGSEAAEADARAMGGGIGDLKRSDVAAEGRHDGRPSANGQKPKPRPGVRITRKDFTAIPLRDLELLWCERRTAYRKGEGEPDTHPGTKRLIRIEVELDHDGGVVSLPIELRYENTELLYAIPAVADPYGLVAKIGKSVQVVHVPPFSGIGAEETRYDRPFQDLLIGQGKPGDILRNLLLEVFERDRDAWKSLCADIQELFRVDLCEPSYSGRPFILCEYAPQGDKKSPRLDIASAGSGFHQVLLLLGFFYARPASVLLLDEPDAHQHVFLQKQVYDRLRLIAQKRRCQLIVATHSEVILESTDAARVMSFYQRPHILGAEFERQQVREALKRVSSMDLLLVEERGGVLYTEGPSDLSLLSAWATILNHAVREFLDQPLWHNNVGRSPAEARGHHFALRALRPSVRGVLLLDGDNRALPDREVAADGLGILRWKRYEIENYLIVPEVLLRFVRAPGAPLFEAQAVARADEYLRQNLPLAVLSAPLAEHDYLARTPASKTILPGFLAAAGCDTPRSDYYQIAAIMTPDEIHPEVKAKLDEIWDVLKSAG